MSRHKNIPTKGVGRLVDSDDEEMVSSNDEFSYSVSPDTSALYILDRSKHDESFSKNHISFFVREDMNKSKLSEFVKSDDFSENLPQNKSSHKLKQMDLKNPKDSKINSNVKPNLPEDFNQFPLHVSSTAPNLRSIVDSQSSTSLKTMSNVDDNSSLKRGGNENRPKNNLLLSTPISHSNSSSNLLSHRLELITQAHQQHLKQSNKNKEQISIIVIGHVDAGKSTLIGHLLFGVGQVDQKVMKRYQRESQKLGKQSFSYAWVMDQTEEERNRGITMDIGQMAFSTSKKRVTILDAPGHKDFIPKMISGAAQADAAILVVNSTVGEFETGFSGQTKEHIILALSLGINQFIVAVNKMDTVNWSKERYQMIVKELNDFLRKLKSNLDIFFCPVSGIEGSNVFKKLPDADIFKWYDGLCLIDQIDNLTCPPRFINLPLRFYVADVFKPLSGSGVCVNGRVESGAVCCSSVANNFETSQVIWRPKSSDVVLQVKSIQRFAVNNNSQEEFLYDSCSQEELIEWAFAGDYVVLTLTGIDYNSGMFEPCSVLCHYQPVTDYVPVVSKFKAQLLIIQLPKPICRGYMVHFNLQSLDCIACLVKLHKFQGKGSDNGNKVVQLNPRIVSRVGQLEVTIKLKKSICLETNDVCRSLARFTLRDQGRTVAGGTIIEILE